MNGRAGLLPVALATLVLAATVPPAAEGRADDPRWTRVNAPHFIVSGEAPAEDVRETAFLLEMFREVFLRVLPGARDRALVPPFVVVFGTDRAFTPYKPMQNGKTAPVGGYVVQEPLAPCMVLHFDRSLESTRTIFHEYAHVLFEAPDAPLWLREGIADYYSTIRLRADRRHVILGTAVPSHVARLSRSWVPLRDILATSRSWSIWEGDAGHSFYAESWALVHYLMRGTPAKGAQVVQFLERLRRGENEVTAFEQAIGPVDRVEAELRRYVRSGLAVAAEMTLPEQVALKYVRERTMTAAEVEATLGRVLFQLGRDNAALARLNGAISLDPALPEAHMVIGLLHLRRGDPEEALGPLRHASGREPGNVLSAYNYVAAALAVHDSGERAPLEEACDALSPILPPDPPDEVLAVLGTAQGRLGRLEEAEALLRRAAAISPERFQTQVELANVLLRVAKFREARDILEPLAGRGPVEESSAVEQRRRWLAQAETRFALRAELAAAAGLESAGLDQAIRASGSFPRPPELRALRPGEERAAGLLESLDCKGDVTVARLTTGSGPLALGVRALSDVYVSSGRADVAGTLGCGPREGREAVYATWSAGQRLVALEFLPTDYQPRARLNQRLANVTVTTPSVIGQYKAASIAVATETPAFPWAISRSANDGSGLSLTR